MKTQIMRFSNNGSAIIGLKLLTTFLSHRLPLLYQRGITHSLLAHFKFKFKKMMAGTLKVGEFSVFQKKSLKTSKGWLFI